MSFPIKVYKVHSYRTSDPTEKAWSIQISPEELLPFTNSLYTFTPELILDTTSDNLSYNKVEIKYDTHEWWNDEVGTHSIENEIGWVLSCFDVGDTIKYSAIVDRVLTPGAYNRRDNAIIVAITEHNTGVLSAINQFLPLTTGDGSTYHTKYTKMLVTNSIFIPGSQVIWDGYATTPEIKYHKVTSTYKYHTLCSYEGNQSWIYDEVTHSDELVDSEIQIIDTNWEVGDWTEGADNIKVSTATRTIIQTVSDNDPLLDLIGTNILNVDLPELPECILPIEVRNRGILLDNNLIKLSNIYNSSPGLLVNGKVLNFSFTNLVGKIGILIGGKYLALNSESIFVSGTIRFNDQLITGATIYLDNLVTITDSNGFYLFDNLKVGTYIIRVIIDEVEYLNESLEIISSIPKNNYSFYSITTNSNFTIPPDASRS